MLGAQVGDTHGQLADFLWILHRQGLPSERSGTVYLINGDVADRGPNACEIFLLIFGFMILSACLLRFLSGSSRIQFSVGFCTLQIILTLVKKTRWALDEMH